jgi:adenosylcobinamide-GDP ribazoletransferase
MLNDLRGAFSFLTILPLGYAQQRKAGYTFSYYPVVGIVLGVVLFLTRQLPLTPDLSAFFTLLVWIVLSGALHLDGFADCCDALFATTTIEKRLEILKDPRAGSWAVVGVVMLLLGKFLFLREVNPIMLLFIPMMGRWAIVWIVSAFPYARPSGLGGFFRDGFGSTQVITSAIIGGLILLIGIVLITPQLLVLMPIALGTTLLVGLFAQSKLGGVTGDVYGATCECVEFMCLFGAILWIQIL